MTDNDTSTEAVEREAHLLDRTRLARFGKTDPIAALLRALDRKCNELSVQVADLERERDELAERVKGFANGNNDWRIAYNKLALELNTAYNDTLNKAAKVASAYEPKCDTCPSGVTNAILALKKDE